MEECNCQPAGLLLVLHGKGANIKCQKKKLRKGIHLQKPCNSSDTSVQKTALSCTFPPWTSYKYYFTDLSFDYCTEVKIK